MTASRKSLFEPVVKSEKLNENFEHIRTAEANEPARTMLDDIYQDFEDSDGNFLEQFQTTGFDARYFELYLFAYLTRSGFNVGRDHPNPDFMVKRNDITVAVEATTVNPSTSGILATSGKKISDLTHQEMKEYVNNELAIRFGSPLYSKLNQNYYELAHCKDIPFVIAIQAFHDEEAQLLSDNALTQYVYGLTHSAGWDKTGALEMKFDILKEHRVGEKVIPSGFFKQPGSEHISAIVFTNSGTNGKFARMGFQHGYGCDTIAIIRHGYCFNPDPDSIDPTMFSYNLDEPQLIEPWGQGLVVLHNPKCLHAIPKGFFVDAVELHLTEEEVLKAEYSGWHPFMSKTYSIHLGEAKKKLREITPYFLPFIIESIPKREFHAACEYSIPSNEQLWEENGWYSDGAGGFLGVLINDKTDSDWGYIILARDEHFHFRAIHTKFGFSSRDIARTELHMKMVECLSHPKRIFQQ